jgi:pyruvate-formate lyase-activating enzyme
VQVWRALRERVRLRAAWVTNGFVTAEFRAADFDRLRTHE